MAQDATLSTFSYDEEGDPDALNLDQSQVAVDFHPGAACGLKKLSEGGYHKVGSDARYLPQPHYNIYRSLRHLAARTKIPVPRIYAWKEDASDLVGTEYMIMRLSIWISSILTWVWKMPGVPASAQLDALLVNYVDDANAEKPHLVHGFLSLPCQIVSPDDHNDRCEYWRGGVAFVVTNRQERHEPTEMNSVRSLYTVSS